MGDGNFANVFQALLKQGSPPPGAPETMKEYAVKQIDKSKVVGKWPHPSLSLKSISLLGSQLFYNVNFEEHLILKWHN